MLVAFISLPFNMYPIISNVYWELILEQSDSHLLNRKQPWWSLVKISCLFVLVFRIQPSYYFAGSNEKNKKARNLIFCRHYLNFINTYKPSLLSSPVTNLISNKTNQLHRDTLCNYIRQNRQFHPGPSGFRF